MNWSRVTLRPAREEDREFLWRLQCEAMRPNVERQFGPWDEDFQRRLFESSTEPELQQIVELDHAPVGCQWVRASREALELVRLQLLPDAQGRGIGTHLLEALISRSRSSGLPLRLEVFRTSPAIRLYGRLGFRVVDQTASHATMERVAQHGSALIGGSR